MSRDGARSSRPGFQGRVYGVNCGAAAGSAMAPAASMVGVDEIEREGGYSLADLLSSLQAGISIPFFCGKKFLMLSVGIMSQDR